MILHFKNNKNNESSIDAFKDKVVNMNTINNYKVNMTIDLSMDIKALVYIKNKYVYRIEYDFSNVISDVKTYKITI